MGSDLKLTKALKRQGLWMPPKAVRIAAVGMARGLLMVEEFRRNGFVVLRPTTPAGRSALQSEGEGR